MIVCFVGYFAVLLLAVLILLLVELNHSRDLANATNELAQLKSLVTGQRHLLALKATTIRDIERAFNALCAAVHCRLGG